MTFTRRRFLERSAAAGALLSAGGMAGAWSPAQARSRLTAAQLRALRDAVRGPVLSPGSSGYDAARVVFNRRYDGVRPPAVVRARDAADVRAVVDWAQRHDVSLVSRSGGHAYNGASTSDDAVVVDVGRLDRVALGADGIATVGPGARNIDVYAGLARRGATIASGSCPMVGAGGLITGGGMGLAGRELGLALDRVVAFDVVTADGRLRRVDAGHDEDLFWALRGGGGSFGIVTAIRLRVRRVSSAAWFFASFPRSSAGEALAAWDGLAPGATSALTSIFTVPGSSGSVTALGQYHGPEAALRRLVAPLAAVRGARLRAGTSGYLALQRRWAGCADGGLAACHRDPRSLFAASSVYVSRRLSASARSDVLAAAGRGATLVIDAYGGAINDVAPDATAFVHRDARFSVQILSYAGDLATARSRVARARGLIAPHGNGQAYQNYADPSLPAARRAYYGANYALLQSIKAAIDPDDRFRPAQGVRAA
ncbi:MAG TPA: FAD-binding oxidoreductase [Solirubrobacteraceae bacterium]